MRVLHLCAQLLIADAAFVALSATAPQSARTSHAGSNEVDVPMTVTAASEHIVVRNVVNIVST
jgi:hypothetical protein